MGGLNRQTYAITDDDSRKSAAGSVFQINHDKGRGSIYVVVLLTRLSGMPSPGVGEDSAFILARKAGD